MKRNGRHANRKRYRDEMTLNRYFDKWIEQRAATALKPVTPYRYRRHYDNHMRGSIGQRRIREISRKDIQWLQANLLEKVSPGTVNYLMQLLKQILNDAVIDEIIAKNPALNVKQLKETGDAMNSIHRALTVEEQKVFLGAARGTCYYEYFAFLLLTGLRQGEASAMRWKDVDWEANMIHVRSTLTFSDDGSVIIGPPKSQASKRDIPMNEAIRRILRMQEERVTERWGRRALTAQRLIFPSAFGKVIYNATANKAIERILIQLKNEGLHIDHFSCHALRTTFATRFIEQDGNPQTLKTLLGHASLKMTMDLYAHVLPNTKQKEMDMVVIEV